MSNKINVETYDKALTPTAYAVQHDTARVLQLVFSSQYLTESDGLSYVVKKPSGLSTYGPAEYVDQQTARIRFTNQDLAEEGLARGQLKITRATGVISTFDFYIKVTPDLLDADSVESSNEFRQLDLYRQEFLTLRTEFAAAVSAVTTDTEVTNIRVKENGIQASTAGDAVREQVGALKAILNIQKADGYLLDNLAEVTATYGTTLSGVVIGSSTAGTVTMTGTSTNTSTTFRALSPDGKFAPSTQAKVITLAPGKYKMKAVILSGSLTGGPTGDNVDILRVIKAGTTASSDVIAAYKPPMGDAWAKFELTSATDVNITVPIIPSRVYDNLTFICFVCKDTAIRSNSALAQELDKMHVIGPHISPSMFTSAAIMGDSFANGDAGSGVYHPGMSSHKQLSWLQNMARKYGWTDYANYTRGGATTHSWLYHDQDEPESRVTYCVNLFERDQSPKQLYFLAFGINDSTPNASYSTGSIVNVPVGTMADFDNEAWDPAVNNSFYGNLGYIIRLIKRKNSNATICLVTPGRFGTRYNPYADAVVDMAHNRGCLLIDSRTVDMMQSTWWTDHIIDGHPTAPMYAAMADAYADKLSESIVERMDIMYNYDGLIITE